MRPLIIFSKTAIEIIRRSLQDWINLNNDIMKNVRNNIKKNNATFTNNL